MNPKNKVELLKDVLSEVYGLYKVIDGGTVYVDGKIDVTIPSVAHLKITYEALRAYLEEIE